MKLHQQRSLQWLFLVVLQAFAHAALAQYPARPVQFIIAYGTGSADQMGRITASCLGTRMKQPFPVINKPGGNTQVAGNFVKNAPPDGYTLLLSSSSTVTDLATVKEPTFDVRQDLEPLSKLVSGTQGIFVNANAPFRAMPDFVAWAKANTGKVNYGTTGIGSVNHLSTEALALNAGISMVHIPYPQGTGAVLTGLASGELQLVMISLSGARPMLNSGKIRLLSVLEKERAPSRADMSTVIEAVPGMINFTGTVWWGLFLPPKTAKDLTQKLYGEISGCLADPGVRSAFRKLGFEDGELIGNSPEEFRQSILDDVRHLKDIVQRAKLPLL